MARAKKPPAISVEDAIEAYLTSIGARTSASRKTYRSGLRRFEEHLRSAGLPPSTTRTVVLPAEVLEHFHTWLVRVYGRERTSTITTYIGAARSFVRFLARRRQGPTDATFEEMKAALADVMPRVTYRAVRVDNRLHEIVQLVESLPLPPELDDFGRRLPKLRAQRLVVLRDKAMLRVLFTTGMRRAEVVSLDRADLEDGWAKQALIRGKGEHERIVFFDEPTLALIRAYLEARGDAHRPLFLRHHAVPRRAGAAGPGGVKLRLSPQSLWGAVKRYAAMAGVPATTHHFRHAKASLLLNRGASLSEVQDILGHASPETTKRVYAHYEVSTLRDAFDRFSATPEEVAAALAGRRAVR
jgi:site-specific recombinase XerD